MTRAAGAKTRLLLVGAGHANLAVLRSLALRPLHGLETTLVVDRGVSTYSGMVPGVLAGDHPLEHATIPVLPLAAAAGARVVLEAAVAIDAKARLLLTDRGTRVEWDVCGIDVGATAAGLDLPGVRVHAISTRPLGDFPLRVDAALEARVREHAAGGPHPECPRIVVVGGGAAGVEVAFTLEARTRRSGARVVLVAGASGAMPGAAPRVRSVVLTEARRRGIEVHEGSDVAEVEDHALRLDDRSRIETDVVVWATGAAAPPWLEASGLPVDARGFLRVTPTLEVPGHRGLFAAGDCCTPDHAPWAPKAGVHAVRAGAVLERNLRAFVEGRPLALWEPQRHFLSLLNLGDRRALATKWGWVVAGRAAWWLKRRIDRSFVARHRWPADGQARAG